MLLQPEIRGFELGLNLGPLYNRGQKKSGENGKKAHFYHHLLIIPPSPYINVEFQVFHLTLTSNIDAEKGGCHLCAIITNSRHYF